MGEPVPLILNVRGDLDTSNPITDRPLGTLWRARDGHPRYWGPRTGNLSVARVWEGPGTASLYDAISLTTGASTYGLGISFEEQFRDLGVRWTLDIWFRLSSVAYAAGKDEIGLYKFVVNSGLGSIGIIDLSIHGPNVADHERLRLEVTTTDSAGVADTLVGLTGSTRISVGTAQTDKHHVRVVRDGSYLYLILDGVEDGSSSSLFGTHGITGAAGSSGLVGLGTSYAMPDLTVTLKGSIYGALLRDGLFRTEPIEAHMPCGPHATNVHHYYLGRNYALGGVDHYFDAGRFGAHARMNGAGYSIAAANDDTAPAPSPVQGLATWTTRGNRTATSVMCGGQLNTKGVT